MLPIGSPRHLSRFALALLVTACAVRGARAATTHTTSPKAAKAASGRAASSEEQVVVLETVVGSLTIRCYPADAPKTVANFKRLVSQGYYDSLTFHRVVPGFVIQGGDPNSRNDNPFDDGDGGPGFTVPAEFRRKHVQGAVAMARTPDAANPTRASNGSQFYIALRDLPRLDDAYTVFGKVIAGWETVERIVALAKRTDIARVNDNYNPGKLAMIVHARLEPLSHWQPAPPAARHTTEH